jgi:four helix bundle protein
MSIENGRMRGDLKVRTKEFALSVVRLYSDLPKRREAQVIGDQILRSGTSVGAHFREAQRAKSRPDFISKIEGGMQELEETVYWLELLEETGFATIEILKPLKTEADELMAIFVTIARKTKTQLKK